MKFPLRLLIRQRLLLIIILSIIFYFTFSIYTIEHSNQLYDSVKTIIDHPFVVTNAAQTAEIHALKIHDNVYEIYLYQDQVDKQLVLEELSLHEREMYNRLDIIKSLILGEEGSQLQLEARALADDWKATRNELILEISTKDKNEAMALINTSEEKKLSALINKLDQIYNYSNAKANTFREDAAIAHSSTQLTQILSTIILALVLLLLYFLTIKVITRPIDRLRQTMRQGARSKSFVKAQIVGQGEISDMAADYNSLIEVMQDQFAHAESLNRLSERLTGHLTMKDITDRALSFLAKFVQAENAYIYLYDKQSASLHLHNTYTTTELNTIDERVSVGHGIIGQVALERKPILRNATYTFPLIHNSMLCGVAELTSCEPITQPKQHFIDEGSVIIATAIFTADLRNEVEQLLDESLKINNILERNQILLVDNSAEINEKNVTLEVLLATSQSQAEELQEKARVLHESEVLLQAQEKELKTINKELRASNKKLASQKTEIMRKNQYLTDAHRRIQEKAADLNNANKYKSEFMANMSHELRTPLGSIITLSQTLAENGEESNLSPQQIEFANKIHSAGEDLLSLVNDVLDLAKVEAGKMDIKIENLTLQELAQQISYSFRPIALGKGLTFTLDLSTDLPDEISTDRQKLEQILNNLLSNAFKFTHQGYVSVTIEPFNADALGASSSERNWLALSISDSGIGISPDKHELIFEAFTQSDGTSSRKYGGTGLGLSLSKELAKLLGGKITVQSEVGKGSTFTVILPVNYVYPTVSELELDNGQQGKIIREAFNGKKILIVDDDMRCVFTLSNLLEQKGIRVIIGYTETDGIKKLQENPDVDLIIMNILTPEIDSCKVIKEIRQTLRYADLPIIALSAKEMIESHQKCHDSEAYDYLTKPINTEELTALLKKWL